MDFQPRLGVVTRALQLAGPDLLHFFLVAGSVFLCYCVMGFLIFGNSLSWFATLGTSINTCFEMLLGEFADVNTDLRALGGLQVGTAGPVSRMCGCVFAKSAATDCKALSCVCVAATFSSLRLFGWRCAIHARCRRVLLVCCTFGHS